MNRPQRDDPLARLRPDIGQRAGPTGRGTGLDAASDVGWDVGPDGGDDGGSVLTARGRHRTGAAPTSHRAAGPGTRVPGAVPTSTGVAAIRAVRGVIGPVAVTVLSAVVAGGLLWWWSGDQGGQGMVLSAAATTAPTGPSGTAAGASLPSAGADPTTTAVPTSTAAVTVHVAGAVATPGVVVVVGGSRVIDAVDAAGGLRGDADPAGVNLARQVVDGELVVVPTPGQVVDNPGVSGVPAGAGASAGGGTAVGPAAGVDVNRADASQLDTLPGIGPVLAERIIRYREDTGPFTDVDDLRSVPGIGDKVFGGIRDLVTL